jgi:hypothetical protein
LLQAAQHRNFCLQFFRLSELSVNGQHTKQQKKKQRLKFVSFYFAEVGCFFAFGSKVYFTHMKFGSTVNAFSKTVIALEL